MGLITKVGLAKKGTRSLKTTIPEGIVEFLQLSDTDELDWKMDIQNSHRVTIVSKTEEFDESTRIASKHASVKKR